MEKQDIEELAWQVADTAKNAKGHLIRCEKWKTNKVIVEKFYQDRLKRLLYELNCRTLELDEEQDLIVKYLANHTPDDWFADDKE